ncbi:hypothetical protein [Streptococcus agalactiae]|uniref:Uncharacterized protein n=1 Tax=Streptococcus agalactiae MRI Z1-216 TaxID=1154879 RepID=A0AAD3A441_STRAG|nr:hypothetical protein [Streptococcus agalactiae]EPU31252.1 hypothetical protein SAG0161_00475 [Streptococcus agalactiae MRI Z1-213]EPU36771.1 hypothetical protein SAG0162_05760 [Streptococcus agalactiae MRI Z1-214]EPU39633.1 hypothetical protein SAG0164_06280 [Streptococcus agalactiae MRI Z1-216]EPX08840.1 hypothetical protein SAG0165_07320 [Streptococcus agalactiae MRI Z1-217]
MDGWKTMLEVARELDVTKSLVRYHRQKLADDEVKIQDGITYISLKGIAKIKTFLRSLDYDEDFEAIVKNQLNVIQELLIQIRSSPEKNTREVIERFREFLIGTPDSLEVLHELESLSRGTKENEFYFLLADYVEQKRRISDNPFG